MTDALEILGFPQSNFVWACRLAAAFKGVELTLRPEPAHSDAVKAAHPLGKVPVLRHGAFQLCESRAIARYLDQAFPGPALVPAEPRAAARMEERLSLITAEIEPVLIRRHLFAYLFPKTADGAPDRALIDGLQPEVERLLDVLAEMVRPGHAAGAERTLADCFLIPIVFYMRMSPEGAAGLAARPALAAYLDRAMALPEVQATLPPPPPKA